MRWTINLGGKGSDCKIYKISDDQFVYLKESGVEEEALSYEEISEYLNKDLLFEDCDDYVIGPYLDKVWITIKDEDGNQVWEGDSLPDETLDNSTWVSVPFEGENYLVVEDYSKGVFFSVDVQDESFDISKLSFVIKEIAETREIIIGCKYDNIDLTDTKFYGDYQSKGFYYLVSEK
jgi:hypothetical protein